MTYKASAASALTSNDIQGLPCSNISFNFPQTFIIFSSQIRKNGLQWIKQQNQKGEHLNNKAQAESARKIRTWTKTETANSTKGQNNNQQFHP